MNSNKLTVIALAVAALFTNGAQAALSKETQKILKDFGVGFAIGTAHGLTNRALDASELKYARIEGRLLSDGNIIGGTGFLRYPMTWVAANAVSHTYSNYGIMPVGIKRTILEDMDGQSAIKITPLYQPVDETDATVCGRALGQFLAESVTVEQNQNHVLPRPGDLKFGLRLNTNMFRVAWRALGKLVS